MAEKLSFRLKKLCEAELVFPTHKCKDGHICIMDTLHELSLNKEDRKHTCKCGVRWTQDAELAKDGKEWSEAGVIYDGRKGKEKPS